MTKNRTRAPVYLDPGMHHGLEVKGLTDYYMYRHRSNVFSQHLQSLKRSISGWNMQELCKKLSVSVDQAQLPENTTGCPNLELSFSTLVQQ